MTLLFTNNYLRALSVHAALYNLASQIVTINLVLWMVKDRDVSTGAYGLALSAGGVGTVLGTLSALRLPDRLGFGRAFAASLLLSCFAPLLIAAVPLTGVGLAVAVAGILLVSGVGLGNANIYSVTLRQIVMPATSWPVPWARIARSCTAQSRSARPSLAYLSVGARRMRLAQRSGGPGGRHPSGGSVRHGRTRAVGVADAHAPDPCAGHTASIEDDVRRSDHHGAYTDPHQLAANNR